LPAGEAADDDEDASLVLADDLRLPDLRVAVGVEAGGAWLKELV
jgi:hypothetical protein